MTNILGNVYVVLPSGTVSITTDSTIPNLSKSRIFNLSIEGSAVTLQSLLYLGNILSLQSGSLDTNNYDVYGEFEATGSISSSLTLGSSTWQNGDWAVSNNNLTLNPGTSTIKPYISFRGGGKSYNKVVTSTSGVLRVYDSNTISSLEASAGNSIYFQPGKTQAITSLSVDGTSGSITLLRSLTSGSKYTLTDFSGTNNTSYIDVKDSTVTGGAVWNANSSVDSGNNTGWNFIGPQIPVASFTASKTNPYVSESVTFTDTSANIPTSWLWDFGDSSTSTLQNPTHAYASAGTYTVSLTATNSIGSNTSTQTSYITASLYSYVIAISNDGLSSNSEVQSESEALVSISMVSGGGMVSVVSSFKGLPQKDYEYRVFNGSQYVSTLLGVTSEFNYSQALNQNASELNITVARSPDNRVVTLDALKDQTGANILDQNSDKIYVPTETPNSVGAGTDIDLNLNIDIYAFYGGYEQLLDQNSDPILDQNYDQILVPYGNPNGVVVYRGYIADYELVYGDKTGVNIILAPRSTDMSNYIFMSGTSTTVTQNSTDPVQMGRNAMDNYISQGGEVTYDTGSMPLTGLSSSYKFNLQTTREVMDKAIDILPSGYYHFVHPGELKQYMLFKSATASHTFYYQKHISSLSLRKSLTQLVNKLYFVGGDTGGGVSLYKYYSDATSISTYRPGLDRLTDGRVTLSATADSISQSKINHFKDPRYRTSVTISDAVYDIETIRLGQMVAFKNFGTFLDSLLLQIVSVNRAKHTITLDLDMIVPSDTKEYIDVKRQLLAQEIALIPSTPS